MPKDYKAITADISRQVQNLRELQPEAMKGFSQLAQGATKDGALSTKTKELCAAAIAIAVRCDGCIGFHIKKLVALGVTREELAEVSTLAVYMGGGPSLMYAADAMQAYDEFTQSHAPAV